jgi:hypothetical protein
MGEKECIHNFGGGNFLESDHLEDQKGSGRAMLKLIIGKYIVFQ